VSTRTFYKHYSSKEECFLDVHRRVIDEVLAALAVPRGARDKDERVRLSVDAFLREWNESGEAHLELVEADGVGPRAFKQAQWADRAIERELRRSLFGDEAIVPPMIVDGVIAGLLRVAHAHAPMQLKQSSAGQRHDLAQWVTTCLELGSEWNELEFQNTSDGPGIRHLSDEVLKNGVERSQASPPTDDLALLLAAAAKLAVGENRDGFSARRIAAAAGIPRRRFDAYFLRAEDCLDVALDLKVESTMSLAREASETARTQADGIYRVVAVLCAAVAQDGMLSELCFARAAAISETLRRCDLFMNDFEELLGDVLGQPSGRDNDVVLEASVGGLWGIVRNEVRKGRRSQLPWLCPVLSSFLITSLCRASSDATAMAEARPIAV
jgi:AcrR family transcriptional regulator